MNFNLHRPCPKCPLRTDIRPFLRPERAREIAEGLLADRYFVCHETVETEEDEDGEPFEVNREEQEHCAGALIFLENHEQPHQLMRIAERLGLYRPEKLDRSAPVYESAEAFEKACRRAMRKPRRKA